MSLQARLRHSLGERWMELPPRGVDQPLVVGRAPGSDIQVPSVTVGQRHCVLFVHEGRWIVQDVGGSSGTYVNGIKVDGAAFLSVGDAIRLGPDGAAPVLEIDPAGALAGQKGQPAAAAVPPPTAPARPVTPEPAPEPPPALAAIPTAYPGYPHGYGAPQYRADPSVVGWPSDATPQYHTPIRRKRFDSGNGVIIGMVLTLIIAAGTGYWLYRYQQDSTRVVIRTAVPSTGPDAPASGPSWGERQPATQARTRTAPRTTRPAASVPGATAPAEGDAAMATPPEPQDQAPVAEQSPSPPPPEPQDPPATAPTDDLGWKQVLAARHLKDEGKAILLFDDYARTHPDAPADKLQELTEAMLDRAWFERLAGLCDEREDLQRKVAELDREIAEDADQSYKKNVAIPLREKYVALLRTIEQELTSTMKYSGKTVPNLLDDEELEKLRKTRDPQLYAAWKGRILTHIRRTHGELPWVTKKSM